MGTISLATTIRLFANAGNHCAFPDCEEELIRSDGVIVGEACHIKARRRGGPRYDPEQTEKERHAYDNLILMCRNHHKVVDTLPDAYTIEVLHEMKALAQATYGRPERPSDAIYARLLMAGPQQISVTVKNSNVAVNSPNAIQANVVNFRSTRKVAAIVSPPSDAIGAHGDSARYVEHLISRYNEYAKSEPTRSRAFSFAVIRKSIEHNFGSPWKLVPLTRFDELCDYLQGRITQTRIGKRNKANGIKNFSSFAEYTLKHRG